MRKTKKAVAAILTLLLIVSMTACALHGKNLTMDALVNTRSLFYWNWCCGVGYG